MGPTLSSTIEGFIQTHPSDWKDIIGKSYWGIYKWCLICEKSHSGEKWRIEKLNVLTRIYYLFKKNIMIRKANIIQEARSFNASLRDNMSIQDLFMQLCPPLKTPKIERKDVEEAEDINEGEKEKKIAEMKDSEGIEELEQKNEPEEIKDVEKIKEEEIKKYINKSWWDFSLFINNNWLGNPEQLQELKKKYWMNVPSIMDLEREDKVAFERFLYQEQRSSKLVGSDWFPKIMQEIKEREDAPFTVLKLPALFIVKIIEPHSIYPFGDKQISVSERLESAIKKILEDSPEWTLVSLDAYLRSEKVLLSTLFQGISKECSILKQLIIDFLIDNHKLIGTNRFNHSEILDTFLHSELMPELRELTKNYDENVIILIADDTKDDITKERDQLRNDYLEALKSLSI